MVLILRWGAVGVVATLLGGCAADESALEHKACSTSDPSACISGYSCSCSVTGCFCAKSRAGYRPADQPERRSDAGIARPADASAEETPRDRGRFDDPIEPDAYEEEYPPRERRRRRDAGDPDEPWSSWPQEEDPPSGSDPPPQDAPNEEWLRWLEEQQRLRADAWF